MAADRLPILAVILVAVFAGRAAHGQERRDEQPKRQEPKVNLREAVRRPFPILVGDERPPVVDRIAVRYVTPETGGNAQPRFITERELAFFARIEALVEQTPLEGPEYPERYVRAATDRLVARRMLASLLVQRGSEPPDLPRLAAEARAELADRVGGPDVLADALKREGIDEGELSSFLRDQVRAAWYVDRVITPILAVTEDSLREAYRGVLHPFRAMKFDDARARLRRWLVTERLRSAELEFLQGARARIVVTSVLAAGSAR